MRKTTQEAMNKVISDVREYVAETKRIIASIKNKELRESTARDVAEL